MLSKGRVTYTGVFWLSLKFMYKQLSVFTICCKLNLDFFSILTQFLISYMGQGVVPHVSGHFDKTANLYLASPCQGGDASLS